ncbi:methyltransferase [Kribbella sp. NPDC050124]|uniref:methyltransferase n=1 Tax=Kribbella sp. NPDC050124 TaxID=3364114 RepID=UPI00379BFB00
MTTNQDQLLFGATVTKVVSAAAELNLADLLEDGPRSSADLAKMLDADQQSLRRLLRALAGLGLTQQTDTDQFELTEAGGCLRSTTDDSIQALSAMLWDKASWLSWGELVTAIRTGVPGWLQAHGMFWIDYYTSHPKASATFNKAMSQHSRAAAPGLVDAIRPQRFNTILDVGGGDGTLIAELLTAQPTLQGIVFDLSSGLEDAATTLEARAVADRCRLEPGNFFDEVPKGADAYLLKQILHDWDDAAALQILRNCRAAMPPTAHLLILERMLPELASPKDVPTLLVDIHMLVVTGGRERTEAEFRSLLSQAGFTLTAVSDAIPPYDYRVIEAT